MDTLTSIPASFIKDFSSLHVADLTTDEHTLTCGTSEIFV